MAERIDPFDDPGFVPGAAPPQAAQEVVAAPAGGPVDPFDDPTFMPGGVYPRAEPLAQPGGEQIPLADSVRRAVTGQGRMQYPDMPDIMQAFSGPLEIAQAEGNPLLQSEAMFRRASPSKAAGAAGENTLLAGIHAASDPAQVVDMALANLPGSSAREDSFGNPIIDWQGQSYYAWKPGVRQQDVQRLAVQGAEYLGANKGALNLTRLADGGILSRVIALFGANAATSAANDVAAGLAGSKQGVSVPRAVGAGITAPLGESLTGPVSSFGRAVRGGPADDFVFDINTQRVLREQGIDVNQLTSEQAAALGAMMRDAANPGDAVRLMDSQTLPVPVRETRGTVTQDPAAQMFENQSAEGVYGEMAGTFARGVQADQQADLRANVPAIQSRLSGGSPLVNERGQGGAAAQASLVAQQGRAEGAVGTLYDRARNTQAAVSAPGVDEFVGVLNEAAGDFVQLDDAVRLKLTQLRERAALGDVSVDELFAWRREVSGLKNAASDRARAKGLGDMLKAFDSNVDETIKQHLMAGDEDAAKMWLKAVKGRRAMGRRYGANDLVEDLLETEYAGKTPRLKVAPEAATNYIFGKADLGFMNQPELGRDLMKLRKVLGRRSQEWNALREEAFLRFASKAEGATNGATRQFSGVNLLKSWEDALRKNPNVIRILFTEPEINQIGQFARVAARITNPVRGGRNFSGTSHGIAQMAKSLIGAAYMGPKGQALLSRIIPALYDRVQTGKLARQVAPGNVLPVREVSRAGMGAAGGVAGAQGGNALAAEPQSNNAR